MTFRLGFVTGATPDKWARIWRDRSRERLDLVPLTEGEQERVLRAGDVDMAIVRRPIRPEGLHLIPLYEEVPVAVVARDHYLSLAEEVTLGDLAEEQLVFPHRSGWTPAAVQLPWPEMSEKDAVETVASGTGVVILPLSVARLLHRKDVVHRPVRDLDATSVALAWLVEHDDERTQAFVGIVRGRTANSSRR